MSQCLTHITFPLPCVDQDHVSKSHKILSDLIEFRFPLPKLSADFLVLLDFSIQQPRTSCPGDEVSAGVEGQTELTEVFGVGVGLDYGRLLAVLFSDDGGLGALYDVVGRIPLVCGVEEGVGVPSDHRVNLRDLLCDLQVPLVAAVAEAQDDVHPLPLQLLRLLGHGRDLLGDGQVARVGDLSGLLGQIANNADPPAPNCQDHAGLGEALHVWSLTDVDVADHAGRGLVPEERNKSGHPVVQLVVTQGDRVELQQVVESAKLGLLENNWKN